MDGTDWLASVRSAASADDAERLRDLFRRAVDAWGSEVASRRWQEALSAYDAGAITG